MESNINKSLTPTNTGSTGSPRIQAQAKGFQAVRKAHQSEIVEDYVELISDLIEKCGEARPVDIASHMGVTQPTVVKNLARLQRDGFITREKYRSIFLTKTGAELADICRHRHRIIVTFLLHLGLDAETAEHDAEGLEHHVSDKTLAAFEAALEK
ncbi:MAG: transcriptional regulator MntR [Hyphomicrobiales bacterium]|nr:MAG: transcriptional regulator MntR [Hyphomicrobiales bacterium]